MCGVRERSGNEGGGPIRGRALSRWVANQNRVYKEGEGVRGKQSLRQEAKPQGHRDMADERCRWWEEQGNRPQQWTGGKALTLLHIEGCPDLDGERDRARLLGQKLIKGVSRPSRPPKWPGGWCHCQWIGCLGQGAAEEFSSGHMSELSTGTGKWPCPSGSGEHWSGGRTRDPTEFSHLPTGARGTPESPWEELIKRWPKGQASELVLLKALLCLACSIA